MLSVARFFPCEKALRASAAEAIGAHRRIAGLDLSELPSFPALEREVRAVVAVDGRRLGGAVPDLSGVLDPGVVVGMTECDEGVEGVTALRCRREVAVLERGHGRLDAGLLEPRSHEGEVGPVEVLGLVR